MFRIRNLFIASALFSDLAAGALVFNIQPGASTVMTGQNFTLDVVVQGAVDLYGYQFDIGFDPVKLQATSVAEGAFLGTGGGTIFFPGTIDNTGGTITLIANILGTAVPGVNGNGTLARISFSAIGPGDSPVGIFNATALDSFGQGIALTSTGGTVTVAGTAIPEPSFAFALIFALGVLLVLKNQNFRAS